MKVKKCFVIIFAVCLAVLLFAGCVGDTKELDTEQTRASEQAEEETEEEKSTVPETRETGMASAAETRPSKTSEAVSDKTTAAETETVKPTNTAAEKVTDIKASVITVHHIGDTLSAADFDVRVIMSDGTEMNNPSGWSAAPLLISGSPHLIMVSYGGFTKEISYTPAAMPSSPTVSPAAVAAPQTQAPTAPSTTAAAPQTQAPIATTTAAPTVPPAPLNPGITYVLNINSMKFHYPGCASVDQMSAHNRQDTTMSREEIINAGYDPCKNCCP